MLKVYKVERIVEEKTINQRIEQQNLNKMQNKKIKFKQVLNMFE